ncbi:hypothetical protein OG21DRAFT_1505922 [Imleria badia]|nr:hypothetical protein OG21DRAFT_1505922 [Imleria badia]
MLPSKRILTKDEPHDKEIHCKRARISQNTPTLPKGVDTDPMVKSEDITEILDAGTVFKARRNLSQNDLPPECVHGYRVAFRPAIKDFVGTLGPWEFPADEDIARIWNGFFPKHQIEPSKGLHTIVSKLAEDAIRHWRRDMAAAAVECLNLDLKSSSSSKSKRVARAACMLGDDAKDRKRPFYYKKYENGVQPSGIFQSPIIAATLATHLSSISSLPEESRLCDHPVGALALSILAVKRALTWAKTGVDSIPKTPEGHFSRANWGDHHRLEDDQYVLVKAASNIVAVINKLRDIQWERILKEADKYAKGKNVPAALKALVEDGAGDGESDFELEDWDDDFE